MKELKQLFTNNRLWAEKKVREDPEVFNRLSN